MQEENNDLQESPIVVEGDSVQEKAGEALSEPRASSSHQDGAAVARKITGWTRFVAGVPAIGLFICSVVMAVATFVDMIGETIACVTEGAPLTTLATDYIEFADIFLLAVVLYIMALGLFTLFVTDKVPLPEWLEFHDFDDLKERLVSVLCVMLGVTFLGIVMKGQSGLDLLWLGLSMATVIVALTLFVRLIIKGGE